MFQHELHVMSNHHNRMTLLLKTVQESHDICVSLVILTSCWLIQDNDFRFQNQDRCNGHALFLTKGKRRNGPFTKTIETTSLQDLMNTLFNLSLFNPSQTQTKSHLIKNHSLANHLIWVLQNKAYTF